MITCKGSWIFVRLSSWLVCPNCVCNWRIIALYSRHERHEVRHIDTMCNTATRVSAKIRTIHNWYNYDFHLNYWKSFHALSISLPFKLNMIYVHPGNFGPTNYPKPVRLREEDMVSIQYLCWNIFWKIFFYGFYFQNLTSGMQFIYSCSVRRHFYFMKFKILKIKIQKNKIPKKYPKKVMDSLKLISPAADNISPAADNSWYPCWSYPWIHRSFTKTELIS